MKSNTRGNQKLQVLESILQSDTEGLRRFILSIVQSPTDAEDILQNGIVRCIEKAVELKDPSKARAWVLSVFRNLALDFLRERQKNLLLISPTTPSELEMLPDPKESITENSICGCVAELMKELPKNYSSLLNEVEIEGESVKQLAKELGSSPNKLSVQLHRARKSLKTALKEKCEVETYASCLECEC